jgi:hypothetical protein
LSPRSRIRAIVLVAAICVCGFGLLLLFTEGVQCISGAETCLQLGSYGGEDLGSPEIKGGSERLGSLDPASENDQEGTKIIEDKVHSNRAQIVQWLESNGLLTIVILASNIALFYVGFSWGASKRRHKRSTTTVFYDQNGLYRDEQINNEDRNLALVKKINVETHQLREIVDNISNILSHDPAQNPTASTSYFPSTMHGQRSTRTYPVEHIEESEAERTLLRILNELGKAGGTLFALNDKAAKIKREAFLEQSSARSLEKELRASEQRERSLEHALRDRDSERNLLRQEVARLSEERNVAARDKAEAANLKAEAFELSRSYNEGLPHFIDDREEGTHFENFGQLLPHANRLVPKEVARLQLMLRLFAHANMNDESAFELFWSVHEIGKSLYTLMRTLGYNDSWQFQEANAWAHGMNKEGSGKYSIFVPVVNSNFNGLEMIGGNPQSLIQEVRSWGVRNRRGDTERKAIVS